MRLNFLFCKFDCTVRGMDINLKIAQRGVGTSILALELPSNILKGLLTLPPLNREVMLLLSSSCFALSLVATIISRQLQSEKATVV